MLPSPEASLTLLGGGLTLHSASLSGEFLAHMSSLAILDTHDIAVAGITGTQMRFPSPWKLPLQPS